MKQNRTQIENIKIGSFVEFKEYSQKSSYILKTSQTFLIIQIIIRDIIFSVHAKKIDVIKIANAKIHYKINNCSGNKTSYTIYRLNEHQEIQEIDNNLHVQGLSSKIEGIKTTIINENGIIFAQQCHFKLCKLVKEDDSNCFINYNKL